MAEKYAGKKPAAVRGKINPGAAILANPVKAAEPAEKVAAPKIAAAKPAIAKVDTMTAAPAPVTAPKIEAAPAPAPKPPEPKIATPAPAQSVAAQPKPVAPAPIAPKAIEPKTEPKPATLEMIAAPLKKGPTVMATTFETIKPTGEKFIGEINDRAKGAMEKSAKVAEEMTEFTKGNVEAMVASGRVAAKGAETMAQDVAETMKKHFEASTAAMKSFASVKSPTELFQLQSEYAKSYFDSAVADASKFSESFLKLAGDIAQPLSSRYAVAAEKMKATTAL